MIMKTVDFYITPFKNFNDSIEFCCKLIFKAYQHSMSCIIYTDTAENAKKIDSMLWKRPKEGFIPHHINPDNPQQLIVTQTNSQEPHPIWINCRSADKIAPDSNWARCLQIVPNDPELLQVARQQYRHYEDTGATIKTHKIG
jgi:DNA polymerase III subunit chi